MASRLLVGEVCRVDIDVVGLEGLPAKLGLDEVEDFLLELIEPCLIFGLDIFSADLLGHGGCLGQQGVCHLLHYTVHVEELEHLPGGAGAAGGFVGVCG